MRDFGFLRRENGFGGFERASLIAASFESGALELDDYGVLRDRALGLFEQSSGAFVFKPGGGVVGAEVEGTGDGLMKLGGDLGFVGELTVYCGRGLFYGVEKRLVGLAGLERIAASEKIVSKEAVDGGGNFSLAGCVVALAGGLAVEDEAGSESDGERGDGEDDPRASRFRL